MKRCFSAYDYRATWSSLVAMVKLFGPLARDVASQLDIVYPERREQDVIGYLRHLRAR